MDGYILRAPISHIYPSVGYCVVNLGQGLTTTFNQMNGSQLHTFFVYIHEIPVELRRCTTIIKNILMKNFVRVSAIAALFCAGCFLTACSAPSKLMNSSTSAKPVVAPVVAAVFADLEVSPDKITYFMMPSKTVVYGGYDNVINTAVREALLANGNADVLVALETQVKYNAEGQIESVTITGYPAKYVNFRNPGDEYLSTMGGKEEKPAAGGLIGKVKLGK